MREVHGHFEVEYIPGSKRANVYDETGAYRCQLIVGRALNTWLHEMNRSIAIEAEHKIAQRAYRLEAARAYLAARALRPVQPVQLAMF